MISSRSLVDLAQGFTLPERCPLAGLSDLFSHQIAEALGAFKPHAAQIRAGRRRPHPRRWEVLAKLAETSAAFENLA